MTSPSIAGRALLAVVLMIGFYLLAIAIAGVLIYIPYAEVVYAGHLHLKLAFFCLAGAGIILWSIIPRSSQFIPPGPLLREEENPELFTMLRDVALATDQEMPSEVYLIADVNAWVSSRGGWMGFGSIRIMGIGLPLLQLLNVSQLRGVIAHEFGHYYGGDTKLGPWIYSTRAGIARTLQNLASHSSVLQKPFLWYGNGFLRVSHAVSRAQEFSADKLAARVVGPAPLIEGLKLAHAGDSAFGGYWKTEVAPIINKGYRPPVAEGFRSFLAAPNIASAFSRTLDQTLATQTPPSPYDTHPPLHERIQGLKGMPAIPLPENDPPAISLLGKPEQLEGALFDSLAQRNGMAPLKPIGWNETGERIWIGIWKEQLAGFREALLGITPNALPLLAGDLRSLAHRLHVRNHNGLPLEEVRRHITLTIGSSLALALNRDGWQYDAQPGNPYRFNKEDLEIEPFEMVAALLEGTLTSEEWWEHCTNAQIGSIDLASVVE